MHDNDNQQPPNKAINLRPNQKSSPSLPKELSINPAKFKAQLSIYTYKQERIYEAHTEAQEGMVTYVLKEEK